MSETALEILYRRPVEGDPLEWGVIARIQSLADAGRVTEIVAPADGEAPRRVLVEPGDYSIQLLLPSGDVLQEVREVAQGATVRVVFGRRLAGGARGTGSAHDAKTLARTGGPLPRVRDGATFKALDQGLRSTRPGALPSTAPKLAWLREAPSFASLADLQPEQALGLASHTFEAPVERTKTRFLWRFDHPPAAARAAQGWCRVETAGAVELVRLPLLWEQPPGSGRCKGVQLIVDGENGFERAASRIDLEDPRLGGLLSYLDRGRLSAVRSLVNALDAEGLITEAIEDKMANPLGACAAAYVGLAIFAPQERERWDSWLPNIMNFFPEVPDGPILHARRIQLRPRTSEEGVELALLLSEA